MIMWYRLCKSEHVSESADLSQAAKTNVDRRKGPSPALITASMPSYSLQIASSASTTAMLTPADTQLAYFLDITGSPSIYACDFWMSDGFSSSSSKATKAFFSSPALVHGAILTCIGASMQQRQELCRCVLLAQLVAGNARSCQPCDATSTALLQKGRLCIQQPHSMDHIAPPCMCMVAFGVQGPLKVFIFPHFISSDGR